MRRSYPRIETGARVVILRGTQELEGWALNLSAGGVRVMVEAQVELGELVHVRIGDAAPPSLCRVVWLQEEPDGMILGLAYEGVSAPPPPRPGQSQPPFRAAEPVSLEEGPEVAVSTDSPSPPSANS
jgi:hypothetical protein